MYARHCRKREITQITIIIKHLIYRALKLCFFHMEEINTFEYKALEVTFVLTQTFV